MLPTPSPHHRRRNHRTRLPVVKMNSLNREEPRLPVSERVKLELVAIDGRTVATLFEGTIEEDLLNHVDFQSSTLAEGMYFYRLITGSGDIQNRKLLLVR